MKPDDEFVANYEGMVRGVAAKLRNQLGLKCDLDDLIGFGFSGLLEARERFNPSRGVPFKSFAYYRVRGAILDGVRTMTRLPRRAYNRIRAAEILDMECASTGETRAATPELRTDLVATVKAMDGILGRVAMTYSLGLTLHEREHDTAARTPEAALMAEERRAAVMAAVEKLPDRERFVVEGFYLQQRTLDDLAKELGMSKSWASRTHSKALGHLRQALTSPAGPSQRVKEAQDAE